MVLFTKDWYDCPECFFCAYLFVVAGFRKPISRPFNCATSFPFPSLGSFSHRLILKFPKLSVYFDSFLCMSRQFILLRRCSNIYLMALHCNPFLHYVVTKRPDTHEISSRRHYCSLRHVQNIFMWDWYASSCYFRTQCFGNVILIRCRLSLRTQMSLFDWFAP